ncbi:MAG: GGDEF domain-containing protein [Eubacteriales bacterium]|nr:GGDEF domain-containing protein [Eubacteriales bacterium]
MNTFFKLQGAERQTFLQSKYEYYQKFNFFVVVIACLASITYFISDCELYSRFATETLLPRTAILIPLTLYIIINFTCKDYRIMSILSQLIGHCIMWCTIWAIYYLPDKSHASEGFIIMHLVFLTLSYASPFGYATISHILVIFNIFISNTFNHYENIDIMFELGIPCLIGCIAVNIVMNSVFFDTYMTKKQLEESLVIDPLTGIYNRNIIPSITKDGRFSFVRSNTISVLMIDIDYFKQVNDTYGHDKGDQVLKSVSSIIQNCTRGEDYTIRWGGEEFVIIMPNCPVENALVVAERIRNQVMEYDNSVCPTTISVGVANYDNENYESALLNADKALYVAKQTGRNRVEQYVGGNTTQILSSSNKFIF